MVFRKVTAAIVAILTFGQCAALAVSSEADKQAAYCMEASFGYLQQMTKLIALLQSNREKIPTMVTTLSVSPTERDKIAADVRERIDTNLRNTSADRDRRKSDLDVYMGYLKRRGFLDGPNADLSAINEMSPKVREDQIAVSDIYATCLKSCAPDSATCKTACDTKANTSEPSKRMLRCGEIVDRFK